MRVITVVYAPPAGMPWGFLRSGGLVAGLLKRDAGAKDWAQTILGFGGLMDVADSARIVAPAAYWLLIPAPSVG